MSDDEYCSCDQTYGHAFNCGAILVERLREVDGSPTGCQAADEIERLRRLEHEYRALQVRLGLGVRRD